MKGKGIGFRIVVACVGVGIWLMADDPDNIGLVFMMAVAVAIGFVVVNKMKRAAAEHYEGVGEDKKELAAFSKEATKHLYPLEESFIQECKKHNIANLCESPTKQDILKAVNVAKYNENFASIEATEEGVYEAYRKGLESIEDFKEKQKELENKKYEIQKKKQYAKLGDGIFNQVEEIRRINSNQEILEKYCPLAFEVRDSNGKCVKMFTIKTPQGAVCFLKQPDFLPDYFKIYLEEQNERYLKDHPSETVYTGATVGGITTGGFHQTKAYTTLETRRTGYDFIIKTQDSRKWKIESVILNPEVARKAEYGNDEAARRMIDFSNDTINPKKVKDLEYMVQWIKDQLK